MAGFFKAYDMRGTYGVDFDLPLVRRIGEALSGVVTPRRDGEPPPRWLVGRDCRTTSEDVSAALVEGLRAAGADVTDIGLCTTPMVYFFTAEDGYDGSVMVTASHNPPGDNGLKVSKATALPVGYADGLDLVEALVGRVAPNAPLGSSDSPPRRPDLAAIAGERDLSRETAAPGERGLSRALRFLQSRCAPPRSLRYAVDCSNGMASLLARELFPGAVVINDALDGRFPAHSPNPLRADAREQLAALVREKGLDCGVIFDGDADRAMFVDERGEFVQPDYLIPVVARATIAAVSSKPPYQAAAPSIPPRGVLMSPSGALGATRPTNPPPNPPTIRPLVVLTSPRQPASAASAAKPLTPATAASAAPSIVHDVRTSRGAIEALREMGAEPVMVPVGHAFAKPILRKIGAVCGGELAGHYYFSDFYGCDSGALAALRILGEIEAAKKRGETFSEMMRPISGRYANSGEMNFRVADKDAAIARVLALVERGFPPVVSRSDIDGIRLEFAEGWVNVRKSNTEPYLRLIAECDAPARLSAWTSALKSAVEG